MSKTQQRFNQIEAGRWLQQNVRQFTPTPLGSPLWRATLDHYHAHYNNQTYTAFGDMLKTCKLGLLEALGFDLAYGDVMNLLTDASVETSAQVVGAVAWPGATCKLFRAINALGDDVTGQLSMLALAHLAQFMGKDDSERNVCCVCGETATRTITAQDDARHFCDRCASRERRGLRKQGVDFVEEVQ